MVRATLSSSMEVLGSGAVTGAAPAASILSVGIEPDLEAWSGNTFGRVRAGMIDPGLSSRLEGLRYSQQHCSQG